MEIIKGVIGGAQKVVVYGPEGIGKSTFAAFFPDPLFIDTEGSTKNLNVSRMPRPTSFAMVMEQIKYVKEHPTICKTLVVDTADWAEQLAMEDLCAKYQKKGIEEFGYGKGYVYLTEEFARFLHSLEDLIQKGINVVVTAHATMRKFEQPDESGSYDRWELKLKKQTAPLLKEWADMLLFANYKTNVIKDENNKAKARGGKRVMYSTHHPCWDAKHRHGLPDEMPFEFSQIEKCIPKGAVEILQNSEMQIESMPEAKQEEKKEKQEVVKEEKVTVNAAPPSQEEATPLKALKDLMNANNVKESDIQLAVSQRGYFPKATPIANYGNDFISGCLVAAWSQVFNMIQKNWAAEKELENAMPF